MPPAESPRTSRARPAKLAAVALAVLLPAAGCLDYDETLTVEPDGSGHVALDLKLDFSFAQELRKLDPNPDGEDSGDVKSFVTKEEILKDCDVPGITIKSCEVEDQENFKAHVKLAFDFKDLDALRAVRFFSDREIDVAENGDAVDFVYRYNARSALNLFGFESGDKDEPKGDRDRKVKQILDDARKASSARFVLKMPGTVTATNGEKEGERSARWAIDDKNPGAQALILKEPLKMQVTLAKKDAPFWEKEKERKKKLESAPEGGKADGARPEPSPPAPAKPKPKAPGDLGGE